MDWKRIDMVDLYYYFKQIAKTKIWFCVKFLNVHKYIVGKENKNFSCDLQYTADVVWTWFD